MADNPVINFEGFTEDELKQLLRDIIQEFGLTGMGSATTGSNTHVGGSSGSSSNTNNNQSKKFKDEEEEIKELSDTLKQQIDGLNNEIQKLKNTKNEVSKELENKNISNEDKKELNEINKELKKEIDLLEKSLELKQKENEPLEKRLKILENLTEKTKELKRETEVSKQKRIDDETNSLNDETRLINEKLKPRQNLQSARRRNRQAKLELDTTDNEGRRKSNYEAKRRLEELREKYTSKGGTAKGRVAGNITSAISSGLNSGINTIASGKANISSMASKLSGGLSQLGPWGAAAGGLVQVLASLFEMYTKVETAASKYARSVGGSRITMQKMKQEAKRMAEEFNVLGERSYDAAEMIDVMAEYSSVLGRNLEYVSDKSVRAMKDLKDFGVGIDVANMFDTLGYSADMASEKIGAIVGRAAGKGLNAKVVVDSMTKNLKLAQKYTFDRGVISLEKMAQKSASLKYNIEAASNFAEKVNTLEGATTAAAQLSVLGGDFARMGNPLEMLYGGLQDIETLNDKMLEMTKNLVYHNEEKGLLEMSAFNKQRLRQVSSTIGVSYEDLSNMAYGQYKDRIIDEQFKGRTDINEEQKQYIRNIAEMNDKGELTYKINGEQKTLNELTGMDIEDLKRESTIRSQTQEQNVGQILGNTRTIQDRLDDLVNTVKQKIVGLLMKISGMDNKFKDKNNLSEKGFNPQDIFKFNIIKDAMNASSDRKRDRLMSRLGSEELEILKEYGYIDKETGKLNNSKNFNVDTFIKEFEDYLEKQKNNNETNNISGFRNNSAFKSDGGPIFSGLVQGDGTSTDDKGKVTYLSNEEFVIKAKNARKNNNLLTDINEGRIDEELLYNESLTKDNIIKNLLNITSNQYRNSIISSKINNENNIIKSILTGTSSIIQPTKSNNSLNNINGINENLITNNISNISKVVNNPLQALYDSVINKKRNEQIVTGQNPYNFNSVNKPEVNYSANVVNGGNMSFEPLNINIGGKIELSAGSNSNYLTAESILTPQIINKIIKEIQIQTDYGFDRNKVHWKYGV